MYNMFKNYSILTAAYVDIIVLILQVQKTPWELEKLNDLQKIILLVISGARIRTHICLTLCSKVQATVLHYLNSAFNNCLSGIFTEITSSVKWG